MSSYLVLARKWRPQTFADLVGQSHIRQTLMNAIAQNRVAHAFLFTGSRGVGKTSAARIFAKALNCMAPQEGEPCNTCNACLEITDGRSLDVIEIDGASNRGINEIRELRDSARYAPSRDKYKIYIIDEVHMLTTEAFNALLKTLEEPPAHVKFIFATTDPNKVPATILSRCQRYDFKRISLTDLVSHLQTILNAEGIAAEPAALQLVARHARGGMRDALSALDQIIAFAAPPISADMAAEILGVANRETLITTLIAVLDRDLPEAIRTFETVDGYGQSLQQFAFDLLELLRDFTLMAVTEHSESSLVELSDKEQERIKPYLYRANAERLDRMFSIWYASCEKLPRSLAPKVLLEMALIKMCMTENVMPLGAIMSRLDALTGALLSDSDVPADALAKAEDYLRKTLPTAMPSVEDTGGEKKNSGLSHLSAPVAPDPITPALVTMSAVPTPPASESAPTPPAPVVDAPEAEKFMEHALEAADIRQALPSRADAVEAPSRAENTSPKAVEFLAGNSHNASAVPVAWERFVNGLPIVLGAIMGPAILHTFTKGSLTLDLPQVFEAQMTKERLQELTQYSAAFWNTPCEVSIQYVDMTDESKTLAGLRKLRELEEQERAIQSIQESRLLKDAQDIFGITPEQVKIKPL